MIDRYAIPSIDYANHPAYGKHFGSPSLKMRLAAMRIFWPHFKKQTKKALQLYRKGLLRVSDFNVSAEDNPILAEIIKSGAAPFKLDDAELSEIRAKMEPYQKKIDEKISQIAPKGRTFSDGVLGIAKKDDENFLAQSRKFWKIQATMSLSLAGRFSSTILFDSWAKTLRLPRKLPRKLTKS